MLFRFNWRCPSFIFFRVYLSLIKTPTRFPSFPNLYLVYFCLFFLCVDTGIVDIGTGAAIEAFFCKSSNDCKEIGGGDNGGGGGGGGFGDEDKDGGGGEDKTAGLV